MWRGAIVDAGIQYGAQEAGRQEPVRLDCLPLCSKLLFGQRQGGTLVRPSQPGYFRRDFVEVPRDFDYTLIIEPLFGAQESL